MSFAAEHLKNLSPDVQAMVESWLPDTTEDPPALTHSQTAIVESLALGSALCLPRGSAEALVIAAALHDLTIDEQARLLDTVPPLTGKRKEQIAGFLGGTLRLREHFPTPLDSDEKVSPQEPPLELTCAFLGNLLVPLAPKSESLTSRHRHLRAA